LDIVANFHLDLACRAAQIGSVDYAAVLEGDDVGVTGGGKAQSDGGNESDR
jgi:hypothetical protein